MSNSGLIKNTGSSKQNLFAIEPSNQKLFQRSSKSENRISNLFQHMANTANEDFLFVCGGRSDVVNGMRVTVEEPLFIYSSNGKDLMYNYLREKDKEREFELKKYEYELNIRRDREKERDKEREFELKLAQIQADKEKEIAKYQAGFNNISRPGTSQLKALPNRK